MVRLCVVYWDIMCLSRLLVEAGRPRGFGCEAARRRRRSAEVIVGGGGPQRGRTPSRLLAKDAVELGVAAEASLEGGRQRCGAPPSAVKRQKTLQSLLVAKPADRNTGLGPEQPA